MTNWKPLLAVLCCRPKGGSVENPEQCLTPDRVLFSDRHLLVINKASGWLSQGDSTGDPAAADLARAWLVQQLPEGEREGRNLFVAPAHRLDRPVSGVLVLARTSKAARRLSAQFQANAVAKVYLAIAPDSVPDEATVELFLHKDRKRNQVTWRKEPGPGFQSASTHLLTRHRQEGLALVELRPETGRSHQLRVTLASLNAPIVGDVRYRSPVAMGKQLALHARQISLAHPVGGEQLTIQAPMPEQWLTRWPWLKALSI
jgi:23S rRNA pseudouridine1911/1915/1917 synthase